MLHVITSDRGSFLTAADAQLVASLASKFGQLATQTQRGDVLEALGQLTSNVAGLSGQQLASSLVRELEEWSSRFVRPHCQVHLLAKDARGAMVLQGHSAGLPARVCEQLSEGSPPARLDQGQLVYAKLSLAHAGMSGHLYLYHRQHLPLDSADYVRDAAREVSLLLNAEYVRCSDTSASTRSCSIRCCRSPRTRP
jgi:hypothetical protein